MHQHVAENIYNRPWLISDCPSGRAALQQLFSLDELPKTASTGRIEADGSDLSCPFFVQREPSTIDVNGIGHIHVKGILAQGLSPVQKLIGNTDIRDVQAEIAALVAQGAKGLLLCIDSPGGGIQGTQELADTIADTALCIPVYVFSDSQVASAAYWIAAGASKIICTKTAEVGSIGVFQAWIDRSVQWEQEGIASTPVINTGGNLKGMYLFPALSDAHRAELQRQVDGIFNLFSTFVTEMRALYGATVPSTAMQGQSFIGLEALPNGLVDMIGSKQEAYEALLGEIEFDATPAVEPSTEDNSTSVNVATPSPVS